MVSSEVVSLRLLKPMLKVHVLTFACQYMFRVDTLTYAFA